MQSNGVTSNGESASSLGEDANLLMLVQVPLKYREPPRRAAAPWFGGMPMAKAVPLTAERSRDSDMEVAVLGHGALEGPYTELDGLEVERDPRFPVRVTVQFYQAISDANVGPANLERLASQISRVYRSGDYVGSLVVPNPADLGRPTNWHGVSAAPPAVSIWDFPGLADTAESPARLSRPRASGRPDRGPETGAGEFVIDDL